MVITRRAGLQMTTNEKKQSGRIEKLIDLLRSFASDGPAPPDPDYSSWHQTEAEYQAEQAEWLAAVGRRKHKNAPPDAGTDKSQK